jgi:hypothetical protein
VEASRARVSQSDLKIGGGTVQLVNMTSSRRLHRDQVEDGQVDAMGCVGPFYPKITIFYVLDPMGILVF